MCLCMVHAKIEDCLYFYIQAFVLEKVSNILLLMVCRVKISPVRYAVNQHMISLNVVVKVHRPKYKATKMPFVMKAQKFLAPD